MKQSYDFEPKPVEQIVSTGIITTVIRYDIEKQDDGTYECEEVEYNHKEQLSEAKDYGPMVSTIIRSRYSQDQVEALTQNYLADPKVYKSEFDKLQQWRNFAKDTAKRVINIG